MADFFGEGSEDEYGIDEDMLAKLGKIRNMSWELSSSRLLFKEKGSRNLFKLRC